VNTDHDPDFSDDFCRFLQRCVANVDAVELLLTVSKYRERAWLPRELRAELASMTSLSEAELLRMLDVLQSCGLVVRDPDQRVRYRPAKALDSYVATLARLYVERPVTLFRVIYGLRDLKINTFADAFKLRR
jgi:hypothetical protein